MARVDADYIELRNLVNAAQKADQERSLVKAGDKTDVMNPVTKEIVELDVPAASTTGLDTSVTNAITALKTKFNEMFP